MAKETKSPIDPEGQALVASLTRLGEQSEAAYNTVQAVRKMAGDEIISEIRVMRVTVDSDLKAYHAEIKSDLKAQKSEIKSDLKAQKSEIKSDLKAQKAEIKALRWMLGVLIALFSILVALGVFTFVRDQPVERATQVPAVVPQELVRPVSPSATPGSPAGIPAENPPGDGEG